MHAFADASHREIAGRFGDEFADDLVDVEPGEWRGPIESAYGLHLVRVDERAEGRLPGLDEIRQDVLREWQHARRTEAVDGFYRELRERYEVVVEWPAALGTEATP